jgi:hypothetical protein
LSAAAHDVENLFVRFGTRSRFQLVHSLVEYLHAALAGLLLLRIREETRDNGPALFRPVRICLVGLGDRDGGGLILQGFEFLWLGLLMEFCHFADSSVLYSFEAIHEAGLALLLFFLVVEVLLVLEGEGKWRNCCVFGAVEVVVHAPGAVGVVPVQLRLQVLGSGF